MYIYAKQCTLVCTLLAVMGQQTTALPTLWPFCKGHCGACYSLRCLMSVTAPRRLLHLKCWLRGHDHELAAVMLTTPVVCCPYTPCVIDTAALLRREALLQHSPFDIIRDYGQHDHEYRIYGSLLLWSWSLTLLHSVC